MNFRTKKRAREINVRFFSVGECRINEGRHKWQQRQHRLDLVFLNAMLLSFCSFSLSLSFFFAIHMSVYFKFYLFIVLTHRHHQFRIGWLQMWCWCVMCSHEKKTHSKIAKTNIVPFFLRFLLVDDLGLVSLSQSHFSSFILCIMRVNKMYSQWSPTHTLSLFGIKWISSF